MFLHRQMQMRERERRLMMHAQATPAMPSGPAVDTPQRNRLVSLLSELRAILAPHFVSNSDGSQKNDLEAIAYALNAAVVGPAALPSPTFAVISAAEALELLCDPAKVDPQHCFD